MHLYFVMDKQMLTYPGSPTMDYPKVSVSAYLVLISTFNLTIKLDSKMSFQS